MPGAPIVSAHALSAPTDGSTPVLSGVDFEIHAGDRLLLTGPSGSGKSTLLRCMVLLEPSAGEICLDGRPVGPDRVRELRRRVGYVSQRPVAVTPTVRENLAFPRSVPSNVPGGGQPLDTGAQDALLSRLGLEELDRNRRFDSLSGGEQQRLALVRSLTPGPQVLLLDEPTASLDPDSVTDVVDLIREWSAADPGRALVWVSHRGDEVREMVTASFSLVELNR